MTVAFFALRRVATIASLVVVTSCGGQGTNAPKPVASPKPPLTAESAAQALAKAGLPITDVSRVTEANDSNELLGRPGQYSSKVFFYDRRHPKPATGDDGENTIEVFDSTVDAVRRRDYVAEMTKAMPMLTEYGLLKGTVLLRLDQALTPSEAKQYERALIAAVGSETAPS